MVCFGRMAPRHGISSFGATLIVALILTLAALFAWRVWTYKRLIERGETVQLPQFNAQFSAAGDGTAISGAAVSLATEDDPSIGPADEYAGGHHDDSGFAFFDGFRSVQDQIHNQLLDLGRVTFNRRQVSRQLKT